MYVAMKTGAASLWTSAAVIDEYRANLSEMGPVSDRELFEILFVDQMMAWPGHTPWWSYITAMFTHDPSSIMHILGNMIFLWAFGKSIESHIGFWRFLLLYLGGGLAAWGAHALVSDAPGIGASGATSATACLFLAFFPRSHTKVLYLFGLSVFYVRSAWLIGLYFAIDLLKVLLDTTGIIPTDVAAGAHLGGSLFGLGAGLLMLRFGWAPRGEWDLLHLTRQYFRRRAMRASLGTSGPTPWMSGKARGPIATAGPLSAKAVEEASLRASISAALKALDDASACRHYAALLQQSPIAVLATDAQLDLANRACRAGEIALAARAYANYLTAAPTDSRAPEVRLLLAALYVRQLDQPAAAIPILEGLRDRLHDPSQRALVDTLRAECPGPPPIRFPGASTGFPSGGGERRS
jgi:membrane associated rhomboid family serine protease